jgi:amino acid transporter
MGQARERWRDPLLTILTVLLTLIMFVVAPFQAAGVAGAQDIGFAIAVIVIGALVILSGIEDEARR